MIEQNLVFPDPLSDVPGAVLKALQDRSDWGEEQEALLLQLTLMLRRKGYIDIQANPARYPLASVGSSCLYEVPRNKRGHLRVFRGRRVRLVCLGAGRKGRLLMAGVCE